MASQWLYKHGEEQHGPVSSSRLKELAASGQIEPSDLVWKEGIEWTPARNLSGLFREPSTTPPASQKARAVPPPVPGRTKPVPPPVPNRRQPVDTAAAVSENSGSDKAAAGRAFGSKRLVVGGVVTVLLIGGAVILWYYQRPPQQEAHNANSDSGWSSGRSLPSQPKKEVKSLHDQIKGEWTSVIPSSGLGIDFQNDQVVLSEQKADGHSYMLPYQTDEVKKVASFTMEVSGEKVLWTLRMNDNGRLYAQRVGDEQVIVFARPEKTDANSSDRAVGGWRAAEKGGDPWNDPVAREKFLRTAKRNQPVAAANGVQSAADPQGDAFNETMGRLGAPTERFQNTTVPNAEIVAWETGSNEYTVASLVHSIDGHSPDAILGVFEKRSRRDLERMVQAANKAIK